MKLMTKREEKRAPRVRARAPQRTTKSLATIEQRAETIIADADRYDIDKRQAVWLALKNFAFYQGGGGGYFTPEELSAGVAEHERKLREIVTRVEAGERVTESGVAEEYDAAARGCQMICVNEFPSSEGTRPSKMMEKAFIA